MFLKVNMLKDYNTLKILPKIPRVIFPENCKNASKTNFTVLGNPKTYK